MLDKIGLTTLEERHGGDISDVFKIINVFSITFSLHLIVICKGILKNFIMNVIFLIRVNVAFLIELWSTGLSRGNMLLQAI